jgi:hypothetical protein
MEELTYESIIEKINAITDNGNNTAAEVRKVLANILDFTKNPLTTATSNVPFFHFWKEQFVRDNLNNQLWYSFKGIEGQWINFTFRIVIGNTGVKTGGNSTNIFKFPLDNKDFGLIPIFSKITELNQPTVRFIIPFTTKNGENLWDYPLSTSIYIEEKNIVFDFNNIINGNFSEIGIATGKATSSVSFHYPKFFLGKD